MRSIIIAIALTASLATAPSLAFDNSGNSGTTAASDPDQVIKCRKIEITGSLVKKVKACKTVAEWKRIQASGNRNARTLMENGMACAGGSCGNGN